MTWETVLLRDVISPVQVRAGTQALPVYSVTKHSGFVPSSEYFKKQVHSTDLSTYKVVDEGQFAYATIHLDEGSIGVAPSRCVISPMYTVFSIDEARVSRDYFIRFLKSPMAMAAYPRLGRGTAERRKSISLEALGRLEVPLPPLPQQRRIAAILDEADALRSHQTSMIEGLKSTLRRYVGAEVDAIPRVRPVSHFGSVQLGRQRAPKYQTGKHAVPYMRVANIQEDRVDTSDVLTMDFSPREREVYGLRNGDILLNEGQSTELVGRSAIWRDQIETCCFQNTLVRFRPLPDMCVTEFAQMVFLGWLWNGNFQRVSSKTSNIAHLGASRFAAMPFPALALSDQLHHAEFYRHVTEAVDRGASQQLRLDSLFATLQHRAFRGEL